jgi:disulfide bond formation protein DsbB
MNVVALAFPPTLTGRALLLLVGTLAILAAVWILQSIGYTPCELCLTERYAFYAGAPLSALAAWLASRAQSGLARAFLALIALIFLANVGLAFYHFGVEQTWWPGPTACTGALSGPVDVNELAKAINAAPIVNCGDVRLRIFGLSLAAWDSIASLAIAIYAGLAARLAR